MASTQTVKGATWNLDPTHSLVEFRVKHMMITTVRGQFGDIDGRVTLDAEDPARSEVEVEIDVTSLDTRSADRDTHLRSADFFAVEEHPKMVFRSKSVDGAWKEPGDEFEVRGDLTIRGTSREVVLNAVYEGGGPDPWGGERVSFAADTKINRGDYGLNWNQALEAGGVLVGDEVKIHIEAQAVRAE